MSYANILSENIGQSSPFKRAAGRYTTFTIRDSRGEAVVWKGHRTKTKSELRPTKLAKKLVEEED